MLQPKPQTERYQDLITYIRKGYIKIPKFQRDFIWDIEKTAKLLDSVIRGYPIGTFTLWKTKERLRNIKNLGGANLPDSPKGDYVKYVLDGQQRLASLFLAIEGLEVIKNNKIVDYKEIYVDLDEDIINENEIVVPEKPIKSKSISIYDLLSNFDLNDIVKNYSSYAKKIQEYRERFMTYEFSTILLEDAPIDAAVEVFTRINTTGTELTLFEIMVAKTYDESSNFDLYEKYKSLSEELEDCQYNDIPSMSVLQCLAMNIVQNCTRSAILKLNKNEVISTWDKTVNSIKAAIDFFRTYFRIPVSRLLPYFTIIVPFSYFFFKRRKPNATQEKYLGEYFWRASMSYRFAHGTGTKLIQDAKRIDMILKNKRPNYDDFIVMIDKEHLIKYNFTTGDSYCKAILCLYAYFEPKSFKNNAKVLLDNSWLKQSNSKNYHHFFPKFYLNSKKIDNENSIVNITLIDDYLNKNEIKAKKPSKYLNEFAKSNRSLKSTMKSHLISNIEDFGIWDDDYDKFLEKRSKKIIEEISSRIGFK